MLTHGFTVDSDGRKMSKSLGNIIAAKTVMNDLGADILRLWVAATDYRGELTVSDEIFKRTADSYRRIRNTARFLLSNLNGFDPAVDAVSFARNVVAGSLGGGPGEPIAAGNSGCLSWLQFPPDLPEGP